MAGHTLPDADRAALAFSLLPTRTADLVNRRLTVAERKRLREGLTRTRDATDAERHAAAIRHEAEDYVDRKLAAFEVVLDRTMQQVQKGRERLQAHAPTPVVNEADADEEGAFFDQDEL